MAQDNWFAAKKMPNTPPGHYIARAISRPVSWGTKLAHRVSDPSFLCGLHRREDGDTRTELSAVGNVCDFRGARG